MQTLGSKPCCAASDKQPGLSGQHTHYCRTPPFATPSSYKPTVHCPWRWGHLSLTLRLVNYFSQPRLPQEASAPPISFSSFLLCLQRTLLTWEDTHAVSTCVYTNSRKPASGPSYGPAARSQPFGRSLYKRKLILCVCARGCSFCGDQKGVSGPELELQLAPCADFMASHPPTLGPFPHPCSHPSGLLLQHPAPAVKWSEQGQ